MTLLVGLAGSVKGDADDTSALLQTLSRAEPEAGMQLDGHMHALTDTVINAPTATFTKSMSDRMQTLLDDGKFDAALSVESYGHDEIDETKIGTAAELIIVRDNLKVGMRQLPLKMSQEGALMLRQTNMSNTLKEAVTQHMAMKGAEFRQNFELQNSLVDDVAPRLAAMINQNNIWHDMKIAASALGKHTRRDATNPPDAAAMLDPLPALTRHGMASLHRVNLTDGKQLTANVWGQRSKAASYFCASSVDDFYADRYANNPDAWPLMIQFQSEQGLNLAPFSSQRHFGFEACIWY